MYNSNFSVKGVHLIHTIKKTHQQQHRTEPNRVVRQNDDFASANRNVSFTNENRWKPYAARLWFVHRFHRFTHWMVMDMRAVIWFFNVFAILSKQTKTSPSKHFYPNQLFFNFWFFSNRPENLSCSVYDLRIFRVSLIIVALHPVQWRGFLVFKQVFIIMSIIWSHNMYRTMNFVNRCCLTEKCINTPAPGNHWTKDD